MVYVNGLPGVKPNEVLLFESGQKGQVLSMSSTFIEVLIFTNETIAIGTRVVRTNELLAIPVGREMLGHTINPLGQPLSSTQTFTPPQKIREIEAEPGGIATRSRVNQSFFTGVSIVDMLVPLGIGQRELVVGDRKTGKTNFLLQTMLIQAKSGMICIYGAIGKKKIDIKRTEEFFRKNEVSQLVTIVASSSEDPAGLIYLTPYSAMTLAEEFRDQGRNVLLVLDDLSTHAKFYREIALLAKRE